MFDKKIEPIAQRYIRAKLMVEEAEQLLEAAKESLMAVIPEGASYTTKDGESIAHVKSTTRRTFVAEKLAKLLPARIWRAVRIDAVDTKKLAAFIDAGEVDVAAIAEGIREVPVRSSLRVTWPSIKPTTTTTSPSPKGTHRKAAA